MKDSLKSQRSQTGLLLSSSSIALLLSGYSSIGKGLTEAILEKAENEDTRVCEVWG